MAKNTVKKTPELTEGAKKAYNALIEFGKPATLAELNANRAEGDKIASAHFTALKARGMVNAEAVENVCPTCGAKSTRNVYTPVLIEAVAEVVPADGTTGA